MRNIAVLGTGYVGLVTGTCFAELGNRVVCCDTDSAKIALLKSGKVPFYEPGLTELLSRNAGAGRLSFTLDGAAAVAASEVVFIAVGTPMAADGNADLQYVRQAARTIARSLNGRKVVVNKSTVPVETGDLVAEIVKRERRENHGVFVVSNPEFLREGSAVSDFLAPDRIVIGVSDPDSEQLMRDLYAPLNAPIIVTDVRTAEMIKYTANAFLASKISFINEIARICDAVGADVLDVVQGAGSDRRIGTAFMQPGLGFGGSCLPKDVSALVNLARNHGIVPRLLDSVLQTNAEQIELICARMERKLATLEGRRVGLLGLAFKPNTDDVRDSPALALARALVERGAAVVAHDPVASAPARAVLGEVVAYVNSAYEAANDADAVVVATDWNEYKNADLAILRKVMRGTLIVDARNIWSPQRAQAAGLEYIGVGRGTTSVAERECAYS